MTSPLLNGTSFTGASSSAAAPASGSRTASGLLSPSGGFSGGDAHRIVNDDAVEEMVVSSSPVSPSRKEQGKKTNPLQDLIQTEKAYVAELSSIIKVRCKTRVFAPHTSSDLFSCPFTQKVAGAWNRANFPPAELDTMFRNVESIYRVNKTFLRSLKDIGPEPSSPRPLGDLLMRWIDDLEAPYCRYCENYFSDFDTWPAVQSNSRLGQLLAEISTSTDADGQPKVFSDKKHQPGQLWTLDSLFALPQHRLKYYKKLYARLLKSTNPGRSDHRLLVGANEKLDELLEKSRKKISMGVLDDSPMAAQERARARVSASSNDREGDISFSTDGRSSLPSSASRGSPRVSVSPPRIEHPASVFDRIGDLDLGTPSQLANAKGLVAKDGSSRALSPISDSPLSPISPGTAARPPPLIGPFASSVNPLSPEDITSPQRDGDLPSAEQLEKTLDMNKVVDLFTMKPKKCQLRINPPTLPFKRGMRRSADAIITFTPSCTGQEVVWRRAHIFLLTDLFLMCERMAPGEKAAANSDPDGMWLLFPPLAGKHLKVTDLGGPGNALSITILKKETLTVSVASKEEKNLWMHAFADCHAFATQMGLKATQAPAISNSQIASQLGGPIRVSSPSTEDRNLTSPIALSAPSPIISVTPSPLSPPLSGYLSRGNAGSHALPLGREGSIGSVGSGPTASSNSTSEESMRSNANGRPPHPEGNAFGRPMPRPMDVAPSSPTVGAVFRPPQNLSRPRPQPGGPARPPFPGGAMGRPAPPRPMGPGPGISPGPAGYPNRPGAPPGVMMNNNANRPPPARPPIHNRPPPPPPPAPSQRSESRGGAPESRDPLRRPSAPNLRDRAKGAMTPPVRTRSASSMGSNGGAPKLPSEMLRDGDLRSATSAGNSPPGSPEMKPRGPQTSTVSAQMRCRLYLKQSHAQWKSLGNARLKLYHLMPADQKQLVVENDRKMLVSTIVLSDGVERVGKVGVAVEISDDGNRTGIIYMLQMRSEESAQGLFGELIDGSGRTVAIM